jgi:hypothetical protein
LLALSDAAKVRREVAVRVRLASNHFPLPLQPVEGHFLASAIPHIASSDSADLREIPRKLELKSVRRELDTFRQPDSGQPTNIETLKWTFRISSGAG